MPASGPELGLAEPETLGRKATPVWSVVVPVIHGSMAGNLVRRPVRLCAPAAKVHGTNEFDILNDEAHLLCYRVRFSRGTEPNAQLGTVNIGDQFVSDSVEISTARPREFCVPSAKSDPL